MSLPERIKLVWDFKGEDAEHFATHHEIHLKQYAAAEGLTETDSSTEKIQDMHWIAALTVNKADMIKVRDALKPHRGLKA